MRSKAPASRELLENPDVRRWYENLARGSASNADVNLRRLAAFSSAVRKRPDDLVRLNEKSLHDLLLDFVAREERRNVAGSYVMRTIIGVKSWLTFNGVRVSRPIRIRGSDDTPTLRNERVPTQEELRAILLAGTPRVRTACVLIAHAGLRPEVLGNYLGTDGLTLGDLSELTIGSDSVRFERIPASIRVRPELSKNANGYLSFLSSEGCTYVRQYLEMRLRLGEQLTPESDLIHPDRTDKRFIRTINVGDAIRSAIRAAGFAWRPYVLRHYFDTQLLTAESRGKVAHDFRVYWMGHVGSIDARYTTNKRRLPQDLIDEMRSAYQRCEPFLSTIPSPSEKESQAKMSKTMLMGLGYTEADLTQVDFENLEVAGFQELVTKKLGSPKSGMKQRLVDSAELEGYLEKGWTVVTAVNGHQVVLNPPASR